MGQQEENKLSGEVGKSGGQTPGSGGGKQGIGKQSTSAPRAERGPGEGAGKESQGVPGLATIEVPGEAPKKKQGKKSSSKGKTAKQKKKEESVQELADNLQVLIKTGFDMLSLRAGELWALSQEEAENIASPLARILERHDLSAQASEYGDYIALAVALGLTIAPRVIMFQQEKRGVEIGAAKSEYQGPDGKTGRNNNRQNGPAPRGSNNVKELLPGLA